MSDDKARHVPWPLKVVIVMLIGALGYVSVQLHEVLMEDLGMVEHDKAIVRDDIAIVDDSKVAHQIVYGMANGTLVPATKYRAGGSGAGITVHISGDSMILSDAIFTAVVDLQGPVIGPCCRFATSGTEKDNVCEIDVFLPSDVVPLRRAWCYARKQDAAARTAAP